MSQNQAEEDSMNHRHSNSLKGKKIKKHNENHVEKTEKHNKQSQRKITQFFIKVEGSSHKKTHCLHTPDKETIQKIDDEYNLLVEQQSKLIKEIQNLKEDQLRKNEEFNNYLKKSKHIILNQIKKIYEVKRIEKREINFEKGWYKNNGKVFVNGLRQKQIIELLQKKQKFIAQGDKILQINQRKYIQKQINTLRKQYQKLKKQKNEYKQSLRLSNEQQNCIFAKQNWPLLNKKYQILQLIGKGGFSEVYKAYNILNNEYLAIKLSSIDNLVHSNSAKQEYMKHIIREYEVHQQLKHQNIAQLIEIVEMEAGVVCIALEYCEGVELAKYIKIEGIIQEGQAKWIVKQLFNALKYLNQLPNKIIHYDLKPQNIMFHEGVVKILDFGLCKALDDQNSKIALTSQGVGTYWYLPPQTFTDKNPMISNKVDVWSVGVIFYEMLYGYRPFGRDMTQKKILKTGAILNAQKVSFPENQNINVSDSAKEFIKLCLEVDQEKRIDPNVAYNHPYLNQ